MGILGSPGAPGHTWQGKNEKNPVKNGDFGGFWHTWAHLGTGATPAGTCPFVPSPLCSCLSCPSVSPVSPCCYLDHLDVTWITWFCPTCPTCPCPISPVPPVSHLSMSHLSHLSCPTCPVPPVPPVLSHLSHLSCPTCPVSPVPPVRTHLSHLSCPTCPYLTCLCPTCPVSPVPPVSHLSVPHLSHLSHLSPAVPPEPPLVQAGALAVEGEELELTCLVPRARPPATLRWYRDRRELPGRSSHRQEGKVFWQRSVLRLRPERRDHGAVLTCEASHPALGRGQRRLTPFQLDVQYPPSARIHPSQSVLRQGDTLVLTCAVSGNPR
uniref:Cell adhesion molecule 4-like n=1 Tax=Taeniopygia guttata TaxID=59729 RepID=A0A674GG42_TAEGU